MSLWRFFFGYKVDLIAGGIVYQYKGIHSWEFSHRYNKNGPFEVVYFLNRAGGHFMWVRLDSIEAIGGDLLNHPQFPALHKRVKKETLPAFPSP